MALRNILTDDDPGLHKQSREVTDFGKRLHILLDDMRETLIAADGLGLAATQVGVLRRVALIVDTGIDTELLEDKIIELINPVIISAEGEETSCEGCLSVPGVHAMVSRPQSVIFKAYDRYGDEFEFEASGLTARAVCHETDHMDGIIFTSIAERILTDEEVEEMRAERNKQDAQGKEIEEQ